MFEIMFIMAEEERIDFHARFSKEFLEKVSEMASKTGKDRSKVIEELAWKGMKAKELEITVNLVIANDVLTRLERIFERRSFR